jgi:hypothetical protein
MTAVPSLGYHPRIQTHGLIKRLLISRTRRGARFIILLSLSYLRDLSLRAEFERSAISFPLSP